MRGFGPKAVRCVLSAVIAASLLSHAVAFAEEPSDSVSPSFPDAQEGWFVSDVAWVSEHGIMSGYPDGRFGAGEGLTRAELAALMAKWAGGVEISTMEDTTGLPDLALAASGTRPQQTGHSSTESSRESFSLTAASCSIRTEKLRERWPLRSFGESRQR